MSKRQAGKGSDPRNVGPKFKKNYQEIDWHRDTQQAPDKETSTKKTYVYGSKKQGTFADLELTLAKLSAVDSGGTTPWGEWITLPCPACGGTGFVPK
ncbi:MAG: hypothetical protein ACYSUV_02020 [Planctomycetota bacterium]|jgi:hypothetical protein